MKYLRDGLALFADILAVSPFVIGLVYLLVIIVLAILVTIEKIAAVEISIPLLLVLPLIALAVYPPAKVVETFIKMKSRRKDNFIYENIRWRRSSNLLSSHLTAVCPHCSLRLIKVLIPPEPVIWNGSQEFPKMRDQFAYECPKHGTVHITEKPDIEMYARSFGEL